MSIKKRKKLIVCLLAITILSLSGMTAFANAYTYQNNLPAWQGHFTLVGGGAEKSNKSSTTASHRIDELGNGNSYANCWVDNTTSGGSRYATDVTRCQKGNTTKMSYINGSSWTGSVELRAYASDWGSKTTWIKGYVDFDTN